jgi:hypothetical protein
VHRTLLEGQSRNVRREVCGRDAGASKHDGAKDILNLVEKTGPATGDWENIVMCGRKDDAIGSRRTSERPW